MSLRTVKTTIFLGVLAAFELSLLLNAADNTTQASAEPSFIKEVELEGFGVPIDLEFISESPELLVADLSRCCVERLNLNSHERIPVLGVCSHCGKTEDTNPQTILINSPLAVASLEDGVLVSDSGNSRILLVQNGSVLSLNISGLSEPVVADFAVLRSEQAVFAADLKSNLVFKLDTQTWSAQPAIGNGSTGFDEFSTRATTAPLGLPVGLGSVELASGQWRMFLVEADARLMRLYFYPDDRLVPTAGSPYCTEPNPSLPVVAALACFRRPFRVAAQSGGAYVFITDPPAGSLFFYDLTDGNVHKAELEGLHSDEHIISVATSTDGLSLAVGTSEGRILVYSIR